MDIWLTPLTVPTAVNLGILNMIFTVINAVGLGIMPANLTVGNVSASIPLYFLRIDIKRYRRLIRTFHKRLPNAVMGSEDLI
ncbi:hypothetical protein CFAM422_007289 [Trichoderma lentiforme]|uniref:Uncharacterized protein n=1 Tax=Trichoderma lentiforme TaxID=1567552 RepID=A0A9P4XB09_9HYPO|nr:hypothetical protein CFAM422_007289 [Trichoderma lentiforme]